GHTRGRKFVRTIICVVTFVILLLVGFLATPGLFKIVNPEYLLALREYGGPLAKLAQNAADTDSKMAELQSKISGLEKELRDLGNTAAAKQAAMKIANAPASDIAALAIDFGNQANGIGSQKDQLTGELKILEQAKAGIEANRADLRKKLDA